MSEAGAEGPSGGDVGRARPVTVVLIEDADDLRGLLADLLQATGDFEVVGESATAAEGIEVLRRARPDLLVLDYLLPDGTGAEVAHLARMASPRTLIALLSGLPARQLADAVPDVDAIIEKGRAATSLVAQLRDVVAGPLRARRS